MQATDVITGLTATLAAGPLAFVGAQGLVSLLPNRSWPRAEPGRIAVLIPAHDEEESIWSVVTHTLEQLRDDDMIVVVAHNCSDRTAEIAEAAGARVASVNDPSRTGKGYALSAGVEALAETAPSVVIVLDADCRFDPDSLQQLASQVAGTSRPAQAVNLLNPARDDDVSSRISAIAFLVRNWVRTRALDRVGAAVPLCGTGMALPWDGLDAQDLGGGHLTEDRILGLDQLAAGQGATLCHDAVVRSDCAPGDSAMHEQRTRWEHGSLDVIGRALRSVSARQLVSDPRLGFTVADHLVPPLSLAVVAFAGASGVVVAIVVASGGSWVPVFGLGGAAALFALGLGAATARFGDGLVRREDLRGIPRYVLGKRAIYSSYLNKRQRSWVRTQR